MNDVRIIKVLIHDPDLDVDDIDTLLVDLTEACREAVYLNWRHRDIEIVEDD